MYQSRIASGVYASALTVVSLFVVGCGFISINRSSAYPDLVGHDFRTTQVLYLNRWHEYQYKFIPYGISVKPNLGGTTISDYVATIPAGTRIHVVQVKRDTDIDAGFDYIIADLFLLGKSDPIRFEDIVNEHSQDSFSRKTAPAGVP